MEEDFDTDIFVRLALKFKAIRVIENKLIPTSWRISADILYDNNQEETAENDIELQGALAKVRYWTNNILNGAIIVNRENSWAMNAFITEGKQSVDNLLVLLPDEPTDEVLAQILQSKFNALGNYHISFGAIKIEGDDTNGLSFLFTGEGEVNLPTIAEWIGERSYFQRPWWSRNDASTMDVTPPDDADLTDIPPFAMSLDFLIDQFRPKELPQGKIISREFRPTIIKGGASGS